MTVIDHSGFPHIIDAIMAYSSYEALLNWRATLWEYHERVDRKLFKSVLLSTPRRMPHGSEGAKKEVYKLAPAVYDVRTGEFPWYRLPLMPHMYSNTDYSHPYEAVGKWLPPPYPLQALNHATNIDIRPGTVAPLFEELGIICERVRRVGHSLTSDTPVKARTVVDNFDITRVSAGSIHSALPSAPHCRQRTVYLHGAPKRGVLEIAIKDTWLNSPHTKLTIVLVGIDRASLALVRQRLLPNLDILAINRFHTGGGTQMEFSHTRVVFDDDADDYTEAVVELNAYWALAVWDRYAQFGESLCTHLGKSVIFMVKSEWKDIAQEWEVDPLPLGLLHTECERFSCSDCRVPPGPPVARPARGRFELNQMMRVVASSAVARRKGEEGSSDSTTNHSCVNL